MAIPTVDPILECGDIIFDWDGPVKKADIYQLNKELLLSLTPKNLVNVSVDLELRNQLRIAYRRHDRTLAVNKFAFETQRGTMEIFYWLRKIIEPPEVTIKEEYATEKKETPCNGEEPPGGGSSSQFLGENGRNQEEDDAASVECHVDDLDEEEEPEESEDDSGSMDSEAGAQDSSYDGDSEAEVDDDNP